MSITYEILSNGNSLNIFYNDEEIAKRVITSAAAADRINRQNELHMIHQATGASIEQLEPQLPPLPIYSINPVEVPIDTETIELSDGIIE